ncbi:histidinol-phosphate transaminase [Robiginitalea aurantiaca]|uniref:Histidinol-phosphate aminotransferase n=1 Tax=Robiginitalea aurantiaca TaxID=3056915 RepID=A0ABT7WFU1_9FLAO|nr:histidinol-phosphate transaminase [Robiginitalea aurantiaca]MDM9631788.1 histidinol-phosphate transaminase [Robiginitalea aurantiaca]
MEKDGFFKAIVRPTVLGLKPYSSARDEYSGGGDSMIFLDANENPFDNGVNRYPDPHQKSLKEEIARLRGVSPEQILLGNGSDEVLDLLFRVFCEPNKDSVLTLPPTYGMYSVLAGINAIENIEVPLTSDFQPDVPEILESAEAHTKIIFLCSPNNPTGNSLDSDRVIRLLNEFPGLVVIDEAYIDFSDADGYVPLLDTFPNLVVTQTFSKAYGLAGIRLGVCFAAPEIIAFLKRVKPPYNVNELTQQRALKALADPEKIKMEIGKLKAERLALLEGLKEVPFVRSVFPTDANFILARVDDAPLRYRQLINQGIVVRDRSSQMHCENTLRFTVGTPEENTTLLNTLTALDT